MLAVRGGLTRDRAPSARKVRAATTFGYGAGELEAGVCAACGYTELYTRDSQDIIVDGTNVQELRAKV